MIRAVVARALEQATTWRRQQALQLKSDKKVRADDPEVLDSLWTSGERYYAYIEKAASPAGARESIAGTPSASGMGMKAYHALPSGTQNFWTSSACLREDPPTGAGSPARYGAAEEDKRPCRGAFDFEKRSATGSAAGAGGGEGALNSLRVAIQQRGGRRQSLSPTKVLTRTCDRRHPPLIHCTEIRTRKSGGECAQVYCCHPRAHR
ncbi:hypothetical protein Q5P01_024980 [Channa striata]|uniref:Uncharacterized protein n=1 Tax=Channa striata TaxID=64152 RepID=A0AA88J0N9_CHASR|nr:hypothetical protein Q5P01_024980 [Channa striata]